MNKIFLTLIFLTGIIGWGYSQSKETIDISKLPDIRSNSRDIAPVRKTNFHKQAVNRNKKAIVNNKRQELRKKRAAFQKQKMIQNRKRMMNQKKMMQKANMQRKKLRR